MPGYRKKRRTHGPSKNELKVGREDAAQRRRLCAKTLAVTLPEVAALTIEASFFYPAENLIDRRTSHVAPGDPLPLSLDCPGHCGAGRFPLELRLCEAAAARQERVEWMESCASPAAIGACGCALKASATLRYH